MLLDLFNKKKGADELKPGAPLPKPAAAQQQSQAQLQPQAQPKPTSPSSQQAQFQAGQPKPVSGQAPIPRAAPQQVSSAASNSTAGTPISSSITVDDIYPIIVRRIKDEFKNVAGEAEKLREIDIKIEKISKTFDDFKKFMDDSKTKLDDLSGKTDKFDVALYELLTNQFNPFIKKTGQDAFNSTQESLSGQKNESKNESNTISAQQHLDHSLSNIENEPSVQVHMQEQHEKLIPLKKAENIKINETKQEYGDRIKEIQSAEILNEATASEEENNTKENISQKDYEEELQKIMSNTKEEILKESGGDKMQTNIQEPKENQSVVIHDSVNNRQETASIPFQDPILENEFLSRANKLVPGIKKDLPLFYENQHDLKNERELVREKIEVEDVLDVPKEGSGSHEVSETLLFKETWNDPDAQHLEKTPPKLKRFDLKELLNKFLAKHDSSSKTLQDFQQIPEESIPEYKEKAEPVFQKYPEEEKEAVEIKRRVSAEEQILRAERHRIMDVNISDPRQYFWFSNGKLAKNIPDFIMILKDMPESVFKSHVGSNKNDFANWIRGVFHSDIVADTVSHCITKEEIIRVLG